MIRDASIVDGTGAPARHGDVGVRDGRIVAVGDVDEQATKTVDAEGQTLAPGFVDLDTHYDASAQNIDVAGVTVLGYDECHTVLTDSENFSSSIYENIMGPVMGRTLLEQEGDEHRASQALVSQLFRRSCWSGGARSWSRWWCMS